MAAVSRERGREIVEFKSEDIPVLPSSLKLRSDGMISWMSTDGRCGIAEILPESGERNMDTKARYRTASIAAIGSTNMLQTPTYDSMSRIRSTHQVQIIRGYYGRFKIYRVVARVSTAPSLYCSYRQTVRSSSSSWWSYILALRPKQNLKNHSLSSFLSLETDGDAPLLLGIRVMYRLGMKYLTNLYLIRFGTTLVPIVHKGHLFKRWHPLQTSSFFTLSELTRLHVRFGHPGWQRLYSFLERSTLDYLDKDCLNYLLEIEAACRS